MSRKMKDSGVQWIGEIPEDWKVTQIKYLFDIGRGRVISKQELLDDHKEGYPVYSSQTKNNGILGHIKTYDYDYPQLTWTTDGANAGTVFLREGYYNCTNVCGTLKVKNEIQDITDLNYIYYALYVGALYYKRKDTNGYKIMNNEMAVIKIPIPNFKDQQKIANFLDKKTTQIDTLLEQTKESIEELKAYKQSLITETVTKGLNSNVPMKESGIEWIGEVPTEWELNKLARVTQSYSGGTPSRKVIDYWKNGNIPWVSSGEVNKHYIYDTNEKISELGLVKSSAKFFPENTVLVALNGQGKTKGMSAILKIKATTNQSLVGFISNSSFLNYKYLNYIFISSYEFNRSYYAGGNKRDGIAASNLKQKRIPLPPLKEQEKIVTFLDEKTSQIDQLIEDKTKIIEELELYKQSLIYEYVTGKKEVK